MTRPSAASGGSRANREEGRLVLAHLDGETLGTLSQYPTLPPEPSPCRMLVIRHGRIQERAWIMAKKLPSLYTSFQLPVVSTATVLSKVIGPGSSSSHSATSAACIGVETTANNAFNGNARQILPDMGHPPFDEVPASALFTVTVYPPSAGTIHLVARWHGRMAAPPASHYTTPCEVNGSHLFKSTKGGHNAAD